MSMLAKCNGEAGRDEEAEADESRGKPRSVYEKNPARGFLSTSTESN
jgi:hypothetical protein